MSYLDEAFSAKLTYSIFLFPEDRFGSMNVYFNFNCQCVSFGTDAFMFDHYDRFIPESLFFTFCYRTYF